METAKKIPEMTYVPKKAESPKGKAPMSACYCCRNLAEETESPSPLVRLILKIFRKRKS